MWTFLANTVLTISANLFERGANYLDYGFQIDWGVIIGATRTKTQTYTAPVVTATTIESTIWQQSVTLTHYLVEPNDGVVPKKSQLFPGSQFLPREAKGANHLIQGNHANVRRALELILNDEQSSFFIPKK